MPLSLLGLAQAALCYWEGVPRSTRVISDAAMRKRVEAHERGSLRVELFEAISIVQNSVTLAGYAESWYRVNSGV